MENRKLLEAMQDYVSDVFEDSGQPTALSHLAGAFHSRASIGGAGSIRGLVSGEGRELGLRIITDAKRRNYVVSMPHLAFKYFPYWKEDYDEASKHEEMLPLDNVHNKEAFTQYCLYRAGIAIGRTDGVKPSPHPKSIGKRLDEIREAREKRRKNEIDIDEAKALLTDI